MAPGEPAPPAADGGDAASPGAKAGAGRAAGSRPAAEPPCRDRLGVVVLTRDRCAEVLRTLGHLTRLPERPAIVVVDNGSSDGTPDRIAEAFPQVGLVRLPRNLGAAGRNHGVQRLDTPYVAFCDDDTWWAPGSLARAAALLDAHPRVAALSARVLVGPENRLDPTCAVMAASPLDARGLPGPALVGCMAGACVMRAAAYREVGGYEPRLLIGGEEALLGLDLLAQGGAIVYAEALVVHHHPSPARDPGWRRGLDLRNRLWIAWMRLPLGSALGESLRLLARAARLGRLGRTLREAAAGLPWAWRRRRVVPPHVEAMRRAVQRSLDARRPAPGPARTLRGMGR